jgi:drug/metabolite transporter (DMT)-like permease
MSWYAYVLAGVALAAIVSVLQRKLLSGRGRQKVDPYAYTVLLLAASALLTLVYRQLTAGYHVPDVTLAPLNIAINIIVSTTGTLMMFEALKRLEASRFIVINALRPFFTLLTAFIFIGAVPTVYQLLGGLLIIGGTLVVYAKDRAWRYHRQGLYFATASAVLLGGSLVNDKILMTHYQVLDYLPFTWLLSLVVLIVLRPKVVKAFKPILAGHNTPFFALSALLATAATICIMLGVKMAAQPAAVSMIQQLQTVLVVLLGIGLLKETDNLRRKLVAVPLACCGVILIIIT